MKQGTAELLLLTVIVSRSISYVLSKIGLNGMPPLELLSIRFFLTTVILLILFHKRLPQITPALFKSAGLLGTLLFGCMACELISLTTVASSTVAFLENTSVVSVVAAHGCAQPPMAGKTGTIGNDAALYRHRLPYPPRSLFQPGSR